MHFSAFAGFTRQNDYDVVIILDVVFNDWFVVGVFLGSDFAFLRPMRFQVLKHSGLRTC